MKTNIVGAPKGIGTEALHIGGVSKRLEWLEQQMDETPPFKQAYNNLNERHGRLIEAKNILDKEGLWL
jgi:hypothetical protein